MASRPRNPISFPNNLPNSLSDMERMRFYGSNFQGNSDFQGFPLPSHYSTSANVSNSQGVPPPLPPRADMLRNSRLSNYNNFYSPSPYSRFSPGGMGMYSGYGGFRSQYSRYGMPPGPDSYSSFAQLAEESTRPAFESIESVVDIVGSISMMLESTYHAVYSSYNAILGVVDQFSRLKDHLAEVLSFLALLRGLKFLCLKILYLLRLRKDNPSVEAAWKTATSVSDGSDFSQFKNDKNSPWPFFMFVGLVIGAPWLMFKLLSRSVQKKPFDLSSWKVNNGIFMCVTNYDFKTNRRGELSFKAGEHLYIAPKNLQTNVPRGWILACNNNKQVGLIPKNYLKTQAVTGPDRRISPASNIAQSQQIPELIQKPNNPPESNPVVNPFGLEEDPSFPEIMTVPPEELQKKDDSV